jgi:hypothetical protein
MRVVKAFLIGFSFLLCAVSYCFADPFTYQGGPGNDSVPSPEECGGGMAGNLNISDVKYLKDTPLDTGGDARWDVLEIQIRFTIDNEANSVVAYLVDKDAKLVAWTATYGVFKPGPNEVTFRFEGKFINQSGLNGPYRLSHVRIADQGDEDLFKQGCSRDVGQTGPYQASDFASLPAIILNKYDDKIAGKQLVISAEIYMDQPGDYDVTAFLDDSRGEASVSNARTKVAGHQGVNTVDLVFENISKSGVNGPYRLQSIIVEKGGVKLDSRMDVYATKKAYLCSDFGQEVIEVSPGSFQEELADTNNDGRYEWLFISFQFTSHAATERRYGVTADLYSDEGANSRRITTFGEGGDHPFSPGTQKFTLAFSGKDILKAGVDGRYGLRALVISDAQTGDIIYDNDRPYQTSVMDHVKFSAPANNWEETTGKK